MTEKPSRNVELYTRRFNAGLSPEELGEACDPTVSGETIRRLEEDATKTPRPRVGAAIAKHLQCDAIDIWPVPTPAADDAEAAAA